MLTDVEKTKALMLASMMAGRLRRILGDNGLMKSSEPASWMETAEILRSLRNVVDDYEDIIMNGIKKPDMGEGIDHEALEALHHVAKRELV